MNRVAEATLPVGGFESLPPRCSLLTISRLSNKERFDGFEDTGGG
jgi:hypothetical protein